jgi:hypothetical protein
VEQSQNKGRTNDTYEEKREKAGRERERERSAQAKWRARADCKEEKTCFSPFPPFSHIRTKKVQRVDTSDILLSHCSLILISSRCKRHHHNTTPSSVLSTASPYGGVRCCKETI